MSIPIHPSLQQLRRDLRDKRRRLPANTRLANEISISEHILRLPLLRRCRRLGIYRSEDGEVDLHPLLFALMGRQIDLFLPVLRPGRLNQLWFSPYRHGDALHLNRYSIEEPITNKRPPVSLRGIDIVLMPLVGFDTQLNRLGMGGGYYDRSFAFLKNAKWRRPRLIGIAHECQKVSALDSRPWDVSMDAVVTECGIYHKNKFVVCLM